MRKSNSIFKTAFVSEAGAELANNDYFAYVEDDEYACYVLASGITDFETSEAAKEVVEHLILSFEEKPSMSKTTLLQYMKETNERLLASSHAKRLKASVIMLVTDYEKFRYIAAGNVRLRMYRQGRFFLKSSDMSLANDLIEKGENGTPLDKHDERHNLYAYLGKKDFFRPFASKIYKLADADILTLYSQGLWENVDEQEIDEIFAEASDNPQESVDNLEEVLLSRQPQDLKSYTITAIFVNKIFRDPERERKRLFYIKVAAVIFIILVIGAIIFYIFERIHQNKVETLETTMREAQEFKEFENFVNARENSQKALELARELNRENDIRNLRNDINILDSILHANELFNDGNYQDAYDDYLKSLKYADGNDKKVRNFVQRRLNIIDTHFDMNQFLMLGEHLFQIGEYDQAESLYFKASERAAMIHDSDARDKIMSAIEKIYDKRAAIRQEAEQKMNDKKQAAMTAALNKGDDLLAAGDIEGAQKAYLDARNFSDNPADRAQTSAALDKITVAREKKDLEERTDEEDRKRIFADALKTEEKGDQAFEAGDYASAQVYYVTAIEKFDTLSETVKINVIQNKLSVAQAKEKELYVQKNNVEKIVEDARNLYAEKNFEEARIKATQAKEIYTELGMKSKAEEMEILLQQIAVDSMISNSVK